MGHAFAKIIEVEGEQVLFYLQPDDDCEKLHQIVRVDGVCADVAISGLTYENADKSFADLDETAALRVLNVVRDLMRDSEDAKLEGVR